VNFAKLYLYFARDVIH